MTGDGRVLIVDSEPLAVEVLERRLEDAGFRTRSASGIAAAMTLAREASPPFDVVLLGHKLDDGTGLELVQRVRRDPHTRSTSIALITTLPDPAEITSILEAGADDVLRKPVHRVELVARVRSLYRIKRQLDELRRINASLEELNAALAHSATTDGLTGLANRRCFDQRLLEEVERAHRYGTFLSVLLVDVDHFKKVNDGFGHPAGDAVLRALSAQLRASVRIMDVAARYGGEELVIIAPSTSREGARALGERLRVAIERLSIDVPGIDQPLRVTVSIGVAALGTDLDAAGLLAAADGALYEAKRGGRNRVVAAGADP